MSLPAGWTALAFDAARGVPQTAPMPGPVPGLAAVLVATAADLARLLAAPADQVVHDAADQSTTRLGAAGATDAVHVAARKEAVSALTGPAPDSLATGAVPAWLLVTSGAEVLVAWPPVTGLALPVRGRETFLGQLWVDVLRLAAGSLVRGGECGSRISVGWRPVGTTTSQRESAAAPAPSEEGDPYALLV